jgi:hypothetical protein
MGAADNGASGARQSQGQALGADGTVQYPQQNNPWAGPRRRNAFAQQGGLGPAGRLTHDPAAPRRPITQGNLITPASVQGGQLPSGGIVIDNVDRGLATYANQNTTHLTVSQQHPNWKYRRPRTIVSGMGQAQLRWEYPYRPGRPAEQLTPEEAAPYLRSASGQVQLGAMPGRALDAGWTGSLPARGSQGTQADGRGNAPRAQGDGNGGQRAQGGGNANTGGDSADTWMDELVDFEGTQ